MAQFDVYAGGSRTRSYVVELQSDLLDRLADRVVAPKVPLDMATVISGLTPPVRFNETDDLLVTYQSGSMPVHELPRPVGSSSADQEAIKCPSALARARDRDARVPTEDQAHGAQLVELLASRLCEVDHSALRTIRYCGGCSVREHGP